MLPLPTQREWIYFPNFVVSNAIQAKEMKYRDRYPTNQFLPLGIEIFAYPHKYVDMFSHHCANVIWNLKRP